MATPADDAPLVRPDAASLRVVRELAERISGQWLGEDYQGFRKVGAVRVDPYGAVGVLIVDSSGQQGIDLVIDPLTVGTLIGGGQPLSGLLREFENRYRRHPQSLPPQQQQQQQQPDVYPSPAPYMSPPGPGNPGDDL